jgi:2-polyprenyl-3-methyl-5-hydroxy-6-metoxy-1,4-benzoquinol methylase
MESSVAATSRSRTPPTLSLVEARCGLCGADDFDSEARGIDFEYDTAQNEFRMVRCRRCRHVYLNPRPRADDLGVIYPADYYAYEEDGGGLVSALRRRWEGGKVALYRRLVGEGPRRVLDVGCGNGRFLELLRDFGPESWTLVGIDFDPEAARKCAERGFETHVCRVEDFRAGDGSFDGVIMLQLIEHVDDPGATCDRVFSLLRPGGCFIIETPNLAGLDYRIFRRTWWGHYHFPRHWNLFSSPALHRMLRERGFTIERTEYLISTSAWTISLHNYFLERGYPAWFVRFFHFKNPLLLGVFVVVDALRSKLGGQTSNQRVVARKPA